MSWAVITYLLAKYWTCTWAWCWVAISMNIRSSHRRCSIKKVFQEISQNLQENTYSRVSFLIKFIKKETLAQVFFCEFCEIFKNTFSKEHLRATASGIYTCHNEFDSLLVCDITIFSLSEWMKFFTKK